MNKLNTNWLKKQLPPVTFTILRHDSSSETSLKAPVLVFTSSRLWSKCENCSAICRTAWHWLLRKRPTTCPSIFFQVPLQPGPVRQYWSNISFFSVFTLFSFIISDQTPNSGKDRRLLTFPPFNWKIDAVKRETLLDLVAKHGVALDDIAGAFISKHVQMLLT